jgi:hypothetical protein
MAILDALEDAIASWSSSTMMGKHIPSESFFNNYFYELLSISFCY